MADIVERLRHWSHGLTYDPAAGLMHEAAAEIERLRTLAEHATHDEGSVQDRCTQTVGERLVQRVLITQSLLDDNEPLQAENARLREAIRRLAEQDGTLSVQCGSVTVTLDATLTEAEHDALEFAVETGRVAIHDDAILRKLLERLNHDAAPEARAAEPESSVPPGSVAAPANTHTLTDAEREAVDTAEASLMRESTDLNAPLPVRQRLGAAAAILRGLLERLGGER